MQIPKSFTLGKNKWTVTHVETTKGGLYGRAFVGYRAVHLCVKHNRTKAQYSETFWHEVTHVILHDMGDPRWNDEKFVTAFSKRLNQIVNTAEL